MKRMVVVPLPTKLKATCHSGPTGKQVGFFISKWRGSAFSRFRVVGFFVGWRQKLIKKHVKT
jgi:hypothetical protein